MARAFHSAVCKARRGLQRKKLLQIGKKKGGEKRLDPNWHDPTASRAAVAKALKQAGVRLDTAHFMSDDQFALYRIGLVDGRALRMEEEKRKKILDNEYILYGLGLVHGRILRMKERKKKEKERR